LVWTELTEAIAAALAAAGGRNGGHRDRIELAVPRDPSHGDWTTNVALVLSRELGKKPRELAEALVHGMPAAPALFDPPEIAGPGFLNFRYSNAFLNGLPARIVREDAAFGRSALGREGRVLVEYVSANPTGPLNVVSARAAAVGATLVRLFDATGQAVEGEFYVNDVGNQTDLLGQSVSARFATAQGIPRALPPEGYQGAYLVDVAAKLDVEAARAALARDDADWFRAQALERMLDWQRGDLADYGAEYARWFRESTLHASGAVQATLAELEQRGVLYRAVDPESGYERPDEARPAAEDAQPATWLRTSHYGDTQDRVVVRANGTPTYLLPDLAYHRDKRSRGNRWAIDLWGPDHHAYVKTLSAGLRALGVEPDFLQVIIVQQVNLVSGGQPVKMSKRAGEFVTLRDLMDDVGPDCAKFFFLMRSTSAHLDFDLDLARKQNDDNPAYYVQYAHARIASILRYAAERGLTPAEEAAGSLAAPEERVLVRKLAAFPEVIRGAAAAREPHRIPTYLTELAAEFHRFYHACRVVSDDVARSRDRLLLSAAARIVLRNGLALMGVSAPDRLERADESSS